MKYLTPQSFQTLVLDAAIVASRTHPIMRQVVAQVLEAVEHPDFDLVAVKTSIDSWLGQGLPYASWLGYNKDKEVAASFVYPDLHNMYISAKMATEDMTARELEIREAGKLNKDTSR